jgi:ATP-dependent Clp protease ATP-binding subunit ClpB
VMTSNLGAREMERLVDEPFGFACSSQRPAEALESQCYRPGLEAARRRFSPEFMNRLDRMVVYKRLTDESMRQILELELQAVQKRILKLNQCRFVMRYTDDARRFLMAKGTSARYGARELKRTIERYVVLPLSNLIATRQVKEGDILLTDMAGNQDELVFMKRQVPQLATDPYGLRLDRIGRVGAAAGVAG